MNSKTQSLVCRLTNMPPHLMQRAGTTSTPTLARHVHRASVTAVPEETINTSADYQADSEGLFAL